MPGNARTIPSEAAKSACTFTILSEGTVVSRTYHVLSIIVHKEINRIPSATIILTDGNPAQQTFEISSQPDFEPGKHIEIRAGYRAEEETIFKGMVIRHGIKVRQRSSVLVIECRDEAIKMTIAPRNKYFRDQKDSEVMELLIGNHGLDKTVAITSVQHEELVQYNATDWDFMLCRTDVNGLLCIPNDGKVTIVKPDFSGDAALTIEYGATVHDLDAEIDARFQFNTINASAWNPADLEVVTEEAADPGAPDAGNIAFSALASVGGDDTYQLQHTGFLKQPELKEWASAMMLRHQLAKIRGKVTTDGTAAVAPGQMIQLNGVGDRFEGKLFVTGIRQQIENGTWQTVFQFGLNPEWFAETYDIQQPLAGALLPAIEGLHTGIVTKLEGDPEGQHRIMVRLPLIADDMDGIWSRVATLDAGNERGTFMLPELGDEVIVGFINNDPRQAVILGMCHSAKHPAPLNAADENHEKGYISRSKMKMIFNDDKKSFTLETPAGNKLVLSEDEKSVSIEDQNGSKVTLDSNGCTVKSSKDIKLEASSGNITLTGAGGSIKIESSGITIDAMAKLTLKGAQVEVSGGMFAVGAPMAKFDGMVQAGVIIGTTSISSPTYTPGAGNLF